MLGAESVMLIIPLLAIVASMHSALISSAVIATNNASDHLALLSFKSHIMADPLQALESWGNQSIPVCQWRGVTCGRRGQRRDRVMALDLKNLSLVGVLPSSVANLTFLRRLHLPSNHLRGSVPSMLGHLLYLKHLDLSDNSLEGALPPSLSHCISLENISLGYNSLQSVMPNVFGSLHNLKVLNLGHNKLSGTIPTEFSNLVNLEFLYMGHNELTGEIPTGIGSLVKLSYFSLSSNQLTGPIPNSIGNLSSLTFLSFHTNNLTGSILPLLTLSSLASLELSFNDLTGFIPSQIGNLTSLNFINFQNNRLTGGIPESMGNLNLLEILNLSNNTLTGTIPNSIGNLHLLSEIDLDNNSLEGPLPPLLFNLSNLVTFNVQVNYHLSGSLPLGMGNTLPNLQFFIIDYNQFHGPIPPSLCNASMLRWIGALDNLFTGTIPSCLGIRLQSLNKLNFARNQIQATQDEGWEFLVSLANCSHLQWLLLGHNILEGEIPNSIGNLSSLEYIYMEFNNITGKIPEEIANLVNLRGLFLDSNHLEGTIPNSLGKLKGLDSLFLNVNNLSGPIPLSIGNLTKLSRLHLDDNILNGSIPSSLSGCPLQRLDLSHNSLVGPIPRELFLVNTLSDYLYIQNNMLTGTLPIELGNLINLETLDFSSNQISGKVPASLGDCQVLQDLNASHNNLEGTIPISVEQMKGLLVIDLSYNNLSGNIPQFLANMRSLSTLNISFNNFNGEVPEDGIFSNTSSVALMGNDGLCGGNYHLKLPPCSSHTTKKLSLKIAIAISVGSTCLIVTLTMFIFFKWNKKAKAKANLQPTINNQCYIRIQYAELANATDGFSSENLIGAGSFGSVYKGRIRDDGQEVVVAVKVLNLMQRGASQSFIAECETLRCARHRNLVKILTVCSSIDFQGCDFKALVYEFLPNGNLDQWLHQDIMEGGEQKALGLMARLHIAIDVASSLDYLHQYKPVPILHCDLKPSNVLLDSDMVAHVGDFGLARFLHQETNESSGWAAMRGSIGYAAPEYGLGNEVSTHGDVYSYGIMLLEMFTGRRPTDSAFEETIGLREYVRRALPDRVDAIVDQQLLTETEYGGASTLKSNAIRDVKIACIASIFQVGICCSEETPVDRVLIGDALKELQVIRDRFVKHLGI
ncbi:hypothetical protein EJB05_24813, partial [Eragrostis curvula]